MFWLYTVTLEIIKSWYSCSTRRLTFPLKIGGVYLFMEGCISIYAKLSEMFCNMLLDITHDSAAPNVFAEVIKVTNHTNCDIASSPDTPHLLHTGFNFMA